MKIFQLNVQLKLLSKLATTCLLVITASLLTFIGCAPEIMEPVSKDPAPKIADVVDPPDPVVDPPDVVEPPDPPAPVVPSTYVAVGDGGKIALSTNSGSSWDAVMSGTTADLVDIATDGNNFVAVATNTGEVVRSTDKGATWSVVASTSINNFTYAADGTRATDADDMLIAPTYGLPSGTINAEIEYGNGVFALMTHNPGSARYAFYRSTNGGATWDNASSVNAAFTSAGLESISLAYANGYFLAYRRISAFGNMIVSTDGLTYVNALGGTTVNVGNNNIKVRAANGRFFVFGNYARPIVNTKAPTIYHHEATSVLLPDVPSTWVINDATTSSFPAGASDYLPTDVAYSGSGSQYAFIMNHLTTSNGIIMTTATATAGNFVLPTGVPATTKLSRIIFFNGKFVVAGANGTILHGNPAATTWTEITSGTTADLLEGEATANKIVFVGTDGKIVVSSDGTAWTEKSAAGNTTPYRRLVLIE